MKKEENGYFCFLPRNICQSHICFHREIRLSFLPVVAPNWLVKGNLFFIFQICNDSASLSFVF